MRTIVEYLMAGTVTLMLIGGLILITAARRARDGFEDVFGFHPGKPVPGRMRQNVSLANSAIQSVAVPKPRRRRSNSRPPMLTGNQAAVETASQSVRKPQVAKKTVDSESPFPVETQTAFSSIIGQVSMQ